MIALLAKPSIIPVVSEGTMSVAESTTGVKPASRQASAALGSPAQVKTFIPAASAGVRIGFFEKK